MTTGGQESSGNETSLKLPAGFPLEFSCEMLVGNMKNLPPYLPEATRPRPAGLLLDEKRALAEDVQGCTSGMECRGMWEVPYRVERMCGCGCTEMPGWGVFMGGWQRLGKMPSVYERCYAG